MQRQLQASASESPQVRAGARLQAQADRLFFLMQRAGVPLGAVIQRKLRWGGQDWATLKKRNGVLVFTNEADARRALKSQFSEEEQAFLNDGDWDHCVRLAVDRDEGLENGFGLARSLVDEGKRQKAARDKRQKIQEDGLFDAIEALGLGDLAERALKKGVDMYPGGALNGGLGKVFARNEVNGAIRELLDARGAVPDTRGQVVIGQALYVSDKGAKDSPDRLSQYQANLNMTVYGQRAQVHIDADGV